MKKPSPETEVRTLRRELTRASENLARVQRIATEQLRRAVAAESETKEWKQRFDLLLSRTPEPSR